MPADLITRLFLDSQGFDRNIEKSGKQVDNFKKKSKGLYDQIASVNGRIDALGGGFSKFAGSLGRLAAGATAAMGVSTALSDVVQKSMAFDKSLSSLRSITGLSTEEMKYFQQQAIELGSTSTQTASQVVEAFQLIGGQKAELLDNKEALVEVTRQAIILAEAAGMDVPEAAKALTGSLNQMGESADKAGEYINILAAASQAGSAEIPYLTKAIERSGGAASTVGVKYNELVAAIEAIAPKITEASEAGTSLRNIFLTLEASTDDNLRPSVVGLTAALENLAAKNLDATQMTKMFGKENVTAALAIVKAKDEYNNFLEAITGTNTAIEQQRINNDNLAGAINAVSSAWEGLILTVNKSNGYLKDSANMIAALIGRITDSLKSEEQKRSESLSKSITNEKSTLEKVIKSWEDYGMSREEAIRKTMEMQNGDGVSDQIKEAEKELDRLNKRYEELRKKGSSGREPITIAGIKIATGINSRSREESIEYQTLPGQIDKQKELIQVLRDKNTVYQESVKYLNEQLDALNNANKIEQENTVKVSSTTSSSKNKVPREGSLDYLNAQLRQLNDQLNAATEQSVRMGILNAIDKVNKEKHTIELEATLGRLKTLTPSELPTGNVHGFDLSALNKQLQAYKENIPENGLRIINTDNSQIQSLTSMASLLGSINSLTGEGASGWLSYASTVMQAIAQMIPQINALATANSAAAASGAAASVSSIPIVGWIMAGAAVASVIAAIASAPKFATGGIVPGTSYYGDRVPIMANSGELILNKVQQGNLFRMLNEGGAYGRGSEIRVTGELVGRGSNLVAVIRNQEKTNARTR